MSKVTTICVVCGKIPVVCACKCHVSFIVDPQNELTQDREYQIESGMISARSMSETMRRQGDHAGAEVAADAWSRLHEEQRKWMSPREQKRILENPEGEV